MLAYASKTAGNFTICSTLYDFLAENALPRHVGERFSESQNISLRLLKDGLHTLVGHVAVGS